MPPECSRPPLSVLVVDDEPPARRRLIRLLAAHGGARVVAEAGCAAEAQARLREERLDVAFVDIQMPGADGFALLRAGLGQAAVVFITAHAEHAVRAFECDVLDYLLKPVRPERLAVALARAERWRAARDGAGAGEVLDRGAAAAALAAARSGAGSLALGERGRVLLISLDDVIHIVARDDHSELFLRDGRSHLDATRMDGWERRLPPSFVRVHRSHIVNLRAALCLVRRENGWVVHTPCAQVPVSRSRLRAVRAALQAAAAVGSGPGPAAAARRLG